MTKETLEKLLRTYLRHVANCEGTDFLARWDMDRLLELGLTPEEAELLLSIGEEEWLASGRVL